MNLIGVALGVNPIVDTSVPTIMLRECLQLPLDVVYLHLLCVVDMLT